MASMEALDEKYFDTSFFTLAKKRILWLTVLLITYTISTQLLQHYSATIELLVALAYFIPMLTGSGGNAGTQTATLIIRGIAVGEIKFKQIFRVLKREIGMGIILGSFLGILGFLRAMFMEKNPTLSIVVGIALALTITMATLTGSLLPLLMRKLKLDPAIAAGPFLTTIVDVTSLVIYFETAKWLLSI
jgi:magnesium transporter